jgi:hypothetical protein
MVWPVSKLANPWKCDADGCGILRANDTNHWLILFVSWDGEDGKKTPILLVQPWNDRTAELEEARHACGIPCALKLGAGLIAREFFPADFASTGKEMES